MPQIKFIPVTPADYSYLLKYFAGQPYPLSAYCLSGITVWNNCAYNNFYAVHDRTVLIYENHISDPAISYMLMPVNGTVEFPPDQLVSLMKTAGHAEMRFVPEDYVSLHRARLEELFSVREQPEYEDYIYRRTDLADLKGHKYSKKRNLIKQFEREFIASGRCEVRPIEKETVPSCKKFIDSWYAARAEKYATWTDALGCEKKALFQTMDNYAIVGVSGIAVYIDGDVAGIGIGSSIKSDIGVLNFEKARDDCKGLYQYLDNQCARMLFSGYEYISKESAMGDPGLMQAKESYYPVRKIKSYALKLK